MYSFWIAVFSLIYLLIFLQRAEVAKSGDSFVNLASQNYNWVLRPYVDPMRSASDVQQDLLRIGQQFFGKEKLSEAYVSLVSQLAEDIRNRDFTDKEGKEFTENARNLYIAYKEQNIDVLKKSGFWYFYLLIVIVAIYQIFVNAVNIELERTTDRSRDASTTLTIEGAFNAIDLTILAALTYMYFDTEWPMLGALVFVSYVFHMIRFGIVLSQITNRPTIVALSAYLLSVLMTLIMTGIENMTYLVTGITIILLCIILAFLTVRFVIPLFKDGLRRIAPYAN
jgi:hypothetical protein